MEEHAEIETATSADARAGEPSWLAPVGDFAPTADWRRVFGRTAPIEIDIGSGKGRFLVESARAHPERNFLGIERARKWARHADARVVKSGVTNVRLLNTDAAGFVAGYVPDASVAVYHLYHPDPWPKKRHHKRRIVTPAFVEALARTLEDGGELRIQSDVKSLFDEIVDAVAAHPAFERIPFEVPDLPDFDGLTSFERKYLVEGRSIHRTAFRRRTREGR